MARTSLKTLETRLKKAQAFYDKVYNIWDNAPGGTTKETRAYAVYQKASKLVASAEAAVEAHPDYERPAPVRSYC